ncbi:MAG: carbohydrate kinase family protein [Shinella sp.]|nr:carbohydrate kinase family protein [Shinella sp.]
MTKKTILALGGAHIDRRGRISGDTVPGASNPGSWFVEAGGGTFNAARNLCRLGHPVRLISPRGGDGDGDIVAAAAEAAGVEDTPFIFLDRTTPSYTAILERDGNLVIALADMELYRLFSPRRLQQRAVREAIAASDALLTDANLPAETIAAIADSSDRASKPLAGIGISPAKVTRFENTLPKLAFLFMNEAEARALTGERPQDVRRWPAILRGAGLAGGVVTRGREPAVAFDRHSTALLPPPPMETIGDVTGAGDALAAGFFSGWLSGKTLAEALRRGVAAAIVTVRCRLAVAENMNGETLDAALALVPEAEILS